MAANAKQFKFFFQLTAGLGPNFSKTFKTANDTASLLGNNLREIRSKMKDVSAYQRQQSAVERSRQKVAKLQKEHERLQAEYDATGRESEDLKRKLDDNTEALERAKDRTADETDRLDEMGKALRQAGIDTDNLNKTTQDLQKEYDKLQQSQEKITAINTKIDQNTEKIAQTKSQLTGTIGTIAAIGTAIYAGPVKKAAEFQEQMSGVKAISGANSEQMALLSEKAKEMGATTKFTATEAGEAMEYMAMAGWKTEDMLGGIEGIMNLAAASGEELGSVSDIVTDALTAFGLTASDAGHFSDVLAQAASNANTDVGMMGATFQKVAPVAGALKYSVEDMSLGIGLMASASIKAEVAGTSLKTALSNMASPTKQQAEAMKKYGISLTNTDGSLKSFGEVVQNLRSSLGGLAEAEQVAAATTIFGKESYAGMLAIVNASEKDFNDLTDAVYNSEGAAKRMAEIKLDNLNGSITLAKSAFDALQVELGELLLPSLTKGVQKFTEIVNVVTDFVRENPQAVKTIAKVAVALAGLKVGGLAARLGFLEVQGSVFKLQRAFEIIKNIGMNKYLANLTGGFLDFKNIGSGILGYFTSVKNAAGGVDVAVGGIAKKTANIASGALNNNTLLAKIGGIFSGISGKIGGTVTVAGSKVLNLFLSPFTKMGGKLGGILSKAGAVITKTPLGKIGNLIGAGFGKITKFIAPVGNAIKTVLGPLGNLASSILGPLGGVVGKILPIVGVITTIITVIQLVKNHLQEIRGFIEKTFGSEALAIFDKIVAVISSVGDTIKNIFSDSNIGEARNKIQGIFGDKGVKVFDAFINVLGKVKKAVSEVVTFVTNNIVPVAEQVLQIIVNDVVPGIVNFVKAAAPTIMSIIQSIVDFVGAVIPVIANCIAKLMPVISEIISFIQTYVFPIISQLFGFITGTVLPVISSAIQAILPVITNMLSTALPIIQTTLISIWNIVSPIVEGILKVVTAAMPTILQTITTVINGIKGVISGLVTILKGIIEFVTGVFTGNWQQAWEGIKTIFSGTFDTIASIAQTVLGTITNTIETIKNAAGGVADGIKGIAGKIASKIPGFATGTNNTPETFIAGENGPELITNRPGYTVYTAEKTKRMLAAQKTGKALNDVSQVQTAENVSARMSSPGTIIINVQNSPNVVMNGGEAGNIRQQLEQYDAAFLEKLREMIVKILKEQKEQKGRVAYA